MLTRMTLQLLLQVNTILFELLLLDIDDEEQEQNPFGEDPYEDDYPEDDLDEYEYADIDSELLDDPILLMKWLEKQDKQGQ